MEFSDEGMEPFGEELLQIAIPTDLSLKAPLVFRMIKLLVTHGCLPPGGSPRAELVLDEALANAMVHGNRLQRWKKVRVRLFANQARWGAIVEDEGDGFSLQDLPRPEDLEAMLSEAGRGIMLMNSYVDRLQYSARGNRVMLVRHRQAEPEAAEVAAPVVEEPPPPEAGVVWVRQEGDVTVAELLCERLTEQPLEEARGILTEAARTGRALVLDMHRVRYVSSRAVGLLVALHKLLSERGGILVLAALQDFVAGVLGAVNLDRLLRICPDREQAVARAKQHLEERA